MTKNRIYMLKYFLQRFKEGFGKTFYLHRELNEYGKQIAIAHYQAEYGKKIVTVGKKSYKVFIASADKLESKYPGSYDYVTRYVSLEEMLETMDLEYEHIDKWNVVVNDGKNHFMLMSPLADYGRLKCVYTVCCCNIKKSCFQVTDIVYDGEFKLENANEIEIDPLLQHIDFIKETEGRQTFIYYPELDAISVRIDSKTYRLAPAHLKHIQKEYRIWIK